VQKETINLQNKINNIVHGGDLDAIERHYNIPRNEILDFSGNINPLGFPERTKNKLKENIDVVSTYPDKDYYKLREQIGRYVSADPEHIITGSGATEIISLFFRALTAKNALIIVPAYSEYKRELDITGGDSRYFYLKEDNGFQLDMNTLLGEIDSGLDLLVMCNPNNPTGTAIHHGQMEELLRHCRNTGTFVMVDETYAEFAKEDISSIPHTACYDNLIVVRGVSKFFSAAGLRLGYGICSNQDIRRKISAIKDSWSVNSLADFAGRHLFNETEFIKTTKDMISGEREYILKELKSWKNIRVFDTEANFVLIKLKNIAASEIYEKLIIKKMLIRDASSFVGLDESYMRFCFLTAEKNRLLLKELKELIELKL